MSRTPDDLLRMLEAATAADAPPSCPLDPEAESLRQAWQALGALLDARDAAAAPPVIRHVAPPRAKLVPPPPGTVQPAARPHRSRGRLALAGAAVAAAAVLFAAGTLWFLGRQSRGPVRTPARARQEQPVTALPKAAPSSSVARAAPQVPVKPPTPAAAATEDRFDDLSWDDPLAQQIARAQQQFLGVGGQLAPYAGEITAVQESLRQINWEMTASTM